MPEEQVLIKAEFNPKVRTYWLLSGIIICVVTIVGIAFLPVWVVLGHLITGMYLDRMRCALTTRALKVEKGLLVRVEKTVPLDKVTDVGMVQGPIMRAMGLHTLSIETAGQSSAAGAALIKLTGIRDARAFRDAILKQRDAIADLASAGGRSLGDPATDAGRAVNAALAPTTPEDESSRQAITQMRDAMLEIRDSLSRIENNIEQR